jgi:DNA-binding NarL/FixJ family response regulator
VSSINISCGTRDELQPDVVLMDLRMPGVGGIEATTRVTAAHPDITVVVLTMDDDDDSVFAALRAGARGYLLKEADADDVHRAVLSVARGEAVFGPGIATRVLAHFSASRGRPGPFPQLTARENEVLALLAQGLDNATIARRLVLSEKTVRNRVSDVLTKLQARNRAEAVALARDAGLTEP